MTAKSPLLDVRDLSVAFRSGGREVLAVDRVSFRIGKGETVALVGEFGLGQDRVGAVDPAAAAVSRPRFRPARSGLRAAIC